MMNEQDPLANLWQQQKVKVPGTEKLQGMWQKEKRKQYWYVFLDLAGLAVVPLLFIFLYQKLHWFELLWLVLVGVLSLAFTAYVIWLRRLALFQQSASTSNYLSLMEKQYQHNIQLARSTKLVVYAMPVLFAVMFIGAWYFNYYPVDNLLTKVWISAAILGVLLGIIWVWADRREFDFRQKLVEFKSQIDV